MEKYDAIYARQSVDRLDSISIESQIEYCKYEARGMTCKVFQDKGYSGKNTDRPNYQTMLSAVRNGEVRRIIVYKLDRISRSILDFANMMAEFQENGVDFVSCTEKFDTSTPMGRAMLNICIVFAQLERETIQQRVTDAYISRSRKGFYMGGRIPYGYQLETYMIDGKKTSRYAVIPEEANVLKKIYALYAQPQSSIGDVVRYLVNNGIPNANGNGKAWSRARVADMIKNPIYVKADLDIYRFFKAQGAIIHNDPVLYAGTNGCYLYSEKQATRKTLCLDGHHVVLAPHDGIIDSEIWLKARLKCLNNTPISKPVKAKNTWLAGKIKCAKCGYALTVRKSKTKIGRYFLCSHRMQTNLCDGVGGIDATALENLILAQLKKKAVAFDVLSAHSAKPKKSRLLELSAKTEQLETEIEKLLSRVAEADTTLMGYINQKVTELHTQAAVYKKEIRELESFEQNESPSIKQIRHCMRYWDVLSFDDKRAVLDQFITKIKASQDICEIIWKF